jgi:hypothetical protein
MKKFLTVLPEKMEYLSFRLENKNGTLGCAGKQEKKTSKGPSTSLSNRTFCSEK